MLKLHRQIEEKFKEMGKKRIEEEKRKERRFLYIGETNRSVYKRRKRTPE